MQLSRFECASAQLSLRVLLKRTQNALWIGLALAIGIHLGLPLFGRSSETTLVAKPLTTRFVKRAPRLTKPLELKKHPRPRRRQIQREMIRLKAKADRERTGSSIRPTEVIGSLARPTAELNRRTAFQMVEVEPVSLAQAVEGTKEAKQVVNMSLELLDVDALDTGRYHAMVIQDPSDKRGIRGFFHMGIAYASSMIDTRWSNMDSRLTGSVVRLANTMNRYTHIKTDVTRSYTFDTRELFKTPWVLTKATRAFRSTKSEELNLGQYLVVGGFLFADVVAPGNESIGHQAELPGDRSTRAFIENALATQNLHKGRDWFYTKLPNSHAIYHCFFDFDGPPMGGDYGMQVRGVGIPYNYVEGIYLGDRLALILSDKGYSLAWRDFGVEKTHGQGGVYYRDLDPTRTLQFGVNVIIFALTQEGSITNRVMDEVR